MRKSIVVLIVAVLAVAAGAVVLSLSAPVLDEEVEYRLTSLYYRGQEILVPGGRGRGAGSAGGRLPRSDFPGRTPGAFLPGYGGGERRRRRGGPHVVLSMEDGLFAVYQDPDWSYAIREGEALAAAVEALLPA